jgi:sulfur relay (sulfurtransferase) DsrC/TusE family protein
MFFTEKECREVLEKLKDKDNITGADISIVKYISEYISEYGVTYAEAIINDIVKEILKKLVEKEENLIKQAQLDNRIAKSKNDKYN